MEIVNQKVIDSYFHLRLGFVTCFLKRLETDYLMDSDYPKGIVKLTDSTIPKDFVIYSLKLTDFLTPKLIHSDSTIPRATD